MKTTSEASQPLTWDVAETRRLLQDRYGKAQLELARPVLRAVSSRLRHVEIHYQELKATLATHVDEPLESGESMFDLIFPTGKGDTESKGEFFEVCEANLFACMQALHAVADNMAHALFYSFGWNHEGKPTKLKINLDSISSRLEQLGKSRPELQEMSASLQELRIEPNFKRLNAATNYIKHHGGLQTILNWNLKIENQYQFQMTSFTQNNVDYPKFEVLPFLQNAHAAMSKAVVGTGRALNVWLREHA